MLMNFFFLQDNVLSSQGDVIKRIKTGLRLNYNLSYFSNNFTLILYLQRFFLRDMELS